VVVRQERVKGIWNDETKYLELYNLQKDPTEQLNISDKFTELAGTMTAEAKSFYPSVVNI
jgi:hypothetical protein